MLTDKADRRIGRSLFITLHAAGECLNPILQHRKSAHHGDTIPGDSPDRLNLAAELLLLQVCCIEPCNDVLQDFHLPEEDWTQDSAQQAPKGHNNFFRTA
jgi:hypothetical protein